MPPMELHMLLTLLVGEDPSVLEKAKMPALRSLRTAYAKEGETAKTGGQKPALLQRVVQAVRAAGTGGFSRPPVFGEVGGDDGGDGETEGGAEDGETELGGAENPSGEADG